MKTSTKGINLIKKFEGCRLEAYKCPAGVWTIGYGHTGKVNGKTICNGIKITSAKATALLKSDLAVFEKAVTSCGYLTFKPNQNQFDALVSFAFNCGIGSLNTLVKGRSAKVVSEKMLLYHNANGKALTGLINRRKAEKALFDSPVKKSTISSNVAKKTTTDTAALKKTTTSSTAKTLKKGAKVKIKSGATDANTKGKYAAFVYNTVYTVISIGGDYVTFGLNGVVTGKTKKSNVTLV